MTARQSRERGSATTYSVVAASVIVLVALVITEMAGLVAVRHRATAAADLSALAASQASVAGHDGCAAGRDIARRNGAVIVSCRMDYDVATIVARATSRRWWGQRWKSEVTARAAPEFYFNASRPRFAS